MAHKNKNKGQTRKTAMMLFGAKGKMEKPEERMLIAEILQYSMNPTFKILAREASSSAPEFCRTSFAKLVENKGLNVHDVSREIQALMKSEGLMKAALRLPKIMEQVAEDAMSRDEECRVCNGTGHISIMREGVEEVDPCDECRGKGTIYVMGNTERLKMMFETFGLTSKGGGVSMNLNLNTVKEPDMADLSAALGPILEGKE